MGLHSMPGLEKFVDLAMSILAFLPASVICECSFSAHGQALREDRASIYIIIKSMRSEVTSGLLVLSGVPESFMDSFPNVALTSTVSRSAPVTPPNSKSVWTL